ncbi:hypothetical protein SLA_1042 [Streptomyces laurentii]|uniref:Uncharacterized protein n=1 Tax=Streptomyces laurentii TaxID=39478 RepID=A0A160NW99_STRLU|nr:hypothetical protein SLA_1042 [Streptomyces laurentii]
MLAETICSAVSAAGLGVAAITAYRKRFLTATRIAAYALVPLGLVMTGAIDWVANALTFNPTVWIGFGILGLSWLLFSSVRAVERRRAGRGEVTGGKTGRAAAPAAPAASAPSLGAGRRSAPAKPQQATSGEDDFSDIEAILKKHGI